MSLDLNAVRHIAQLAKIGLNDAELALMQNELTPILALIEKMQAVNTDNILPMSHAQDIFQRLREDKITETDKRPEFLALATQTENNLFLVPKVIE